MHPVIVVLRTDTTVETQILNKTLSKYHTRNRETIKTITIITTTTTIITITAIIIITTTKIDSVKIANLHHTVERLVWNEVLLLMESEKIV